MKKMFRRFICAALAASLMMVSFAGCGNGGGSSASKTVVIGVATDLKTLDTGHMYEIYGNMISYATYDMLFRIKGKDMANPQPSLATEDWTLDATGTVYTLPIRQDVTFTSGNKLTAKDVVWSIQRVINLKSNTAAHVAGIESVVAKDDYTVVITLKAPDASFLTKLASNAYCVLDSEVVKQNGGTDAADAATTDTARNYLDSHSAGSGPFILENWTAGSELTLVKNQNYWGEAGNVEKVIIKEIPDANTQIQMLEKGEIDMALSLNADNISQLEGKEGVSILRDQTAVTTFLIMNDDPVVGGPMANPDVQQAVRLAINYDNLLQVCGDGATLPLSIVPQGFIGAKTRPEGYRNVEKAKELMAKAGYADGFDIELTAANYNSEGMQWTTIAQMIQADLKEIGINVNIKTAEFSVILDPYRNGEIPFLVMHWSPDYYDINNQLAFLPGDTVGERAKWEVDESNQAMVDLGNKIIGESDKTLRAQYSGELQDMMAENSPYAFLLQHPKVYAVRSNLENVVYNDLCKVQLTELRVKE